MLNQFYNVLFQLFTWVYSRLIFNGKFILIQFENWKHIKICYQLKLYLSKYT